MSKSILAVLAALAVPLSAQSDAVTASPSTPMADLHHFVLPLHTNSDDPIGGAYGVWSAGPTWKASFHDGFHFYAHARELPKQPEFGWQFEAISIGGEELRSGSGEVRWDATRHETRRGDLSEIYEVCEEGVEQMFVIHQRPQLHGEVVVRGRVTTNLHADPTTEPRVGEISFWREGEGAPRITYGQARAIDAKGERIDVATSYDGEHLALHVPADFAEHANYPLTIDPLTSATSIGSTPFLLVDDLSFIGTTASGSTVALAVAIVESSATDLDLVGWSTTESGGASPLFGIDVTNSWSTRTVDTAEMPGMNRWLVAFERYFASSSTVAARVQVMSSIANPPAGTTLFAATGTSTPVVAGRRTGRVGLLVCNTSSGIEATNIDAFNIALGSSATIVGSFSSITVGHMSGASAPWCILGTETSTGVRAYLLNSALALSANGPLGTPVGAGNPKVEGDNGRYLATWTETAVQLSSRRLRALRFDVSGPTITLGTIRNVSSVAILISLSNGGLAYDFSTQSHWAASWSTYSSLSGQRTSRVARLGFQGGVVESAELVNTTTSDSPAPAVVCFDGEFPSGSRGSFSCVFIDEPFGVTVYHRRFDYDPNAGGSVYGTSCSNIVLGDGHPPYAGSQYYNINAQGLPPSMPVFISVGAFPTNLPLDPIGMTGCVMLTDPLVTLGTSSDGSGLAIQYLALNDAPLFIGDLYFQWLWLAPGANALGLVNSRGLKVQVR